MLFLIGALHVVVLGERDVVPAKVHQLAGVMRLNRLSISVLDQELVYITSSTAGGCDVSLVNPNLNCDAELTAKGTAVTDRDPKQVLKATCDAELVIAQKAQLDKCNAATSASTSKFDIGQAGCVTQSILVDWGVTTVADASAAVSAKIIARGSTYNTDIGVTEQASYLTLKGECDANTATAAAKLAECNQKTADYDAAVTVAGISAEAYLSCKCALQQRHVDSCDSYNSCFDTTNKEFSDALGVFISGEGYREKDVKSLSELVCHFNTFDSWASETVEDDISFSKCQLVRETVAPTNLVGVTPVKSVCIRSVLDQQCKVRARNAATSEEMAADAEIE